ncbi:MULTISPECIES: hypothetical protein [Photorhabdus]|uniref:DUF2798 domain-containing protein n=1 Tax=Photorhabdus kayaii TaxID=230088 RepID=A0ABX0B0G7_9GAMM|nr:MULTISPECIES: hypothetical protein [Photorhabdus]MCC8375806.1 hypothetical protein [Photorhabdus bodei]MCT8351773.1 hypothetical protein [Photorhabdus kayaii]MDB6368906.1 hypothetical protein [Photorhabdus bodei]NDL12583.1 hypothetical protein [Photorhabdus kayaii]NDL26124.1 hypothetical protein [Photorhabdus kayaii]
MNKKLTLPNSFAISIFLAVLAACLNLILWSADILEMAHSVPLKGLMIIWYLLGWGFAPGCLTALTINSIRGRLPQRVGSVVAMFISFLLVTGICGLVYAYLTNSAFMQIAMGGMANHHSSVNHGTILGFITQLLPSLCATVISIMNAFSIKMGKQFR